MGGAERSRGDRRRRGGARHGLHPRDARGPEHPDRRERPAPLRRPAPAPRDRARAAQERAGADPRRGDLGARLRVRAPGAGGARDADARPHHASSSRTACPPSSAPTASRCSSAAASSRSAATPSCSRATASTRGSTARSTPPSERRRRRMRIVHTESSLGWGGQEIRVLSGSAGPDAPRPRRAAAVPAGSAHLRRSAGTGACRRSRCRSRKKRLNGVRCLLRVVASSNRCDVVSTHSSTDSWLTALALACARPARADGAHAPHLGARAAQPAHAAGSTRSATAHIVTTGEALEEGAGRAQRLRRRRGSNRCRPASTRSASAPATDAARAPALGLPRRRDARRHRRDAAQLEGASLSRRGVRRPAGERGARHRRRRTAARGAARLVDETRLDASARALRRQPGATSLPWLQALDVFALPSYANEGVPQALIQAMLVGAALRDDRTSAASPSSRWYGETALVVPPQQVALLRADAILRLVMSLNDLQVKCPATRPARRRWRGRSRGSRPMLDKNGTFTYKNLLP